MGAVLFAPHNDDETLFAFYSMIRYKAEVVVVLRASNRHQVRERETECATRLAGVKYVQWKHENDAPDWDSIKAGIKGYVQYATPDVVIAPAFEVGGHEDHNAVATICADLHGTHARIQYLTYRRGHGRSEDGTEVEPSPVEKAWKFAALACYASQANDPATSPWFGSDQREFVR